MRDVVSLTRQDYSRLRRKSHVFHKDSLDIIGYFSKAKKMWDEYSAFGATPRCTYSKYECEVNTRLHNHD